MKDNLLDATLAALARLEAGKTGLRAALAGLKAGQIRLRTEMEAQIDRLDMA